MGTPRRVLCGLIWLMLVPFRFSYVLEQPFPIIRIHPRESADAVHIWSYISIQRLKGNRCKWVKTNQGEYREVNQKLEAWNNAAFKLKAFRLANFYCMSLELSWKNKAALEIFEEDGEGWAESTLVCFDPLTFISLETLYINMAKRVQWLMGIPEKQERDCQRSPRRRGAFTKHVVNRRARPLADNPSLVSTMWIGPLTAARC